MRKLSFYVDSTLHTNLKTIFMINQNQKKMDILDFGEIVGQIVGQMLYIFIS